MEQTRLAEAATVAENLLDALETRSDEPISQILLKANRLARLLRDSDAQAWLGFEMRGYPGQFDVRQIGYCVRYFRQGRLNRDGSYKTASLPEIEAQIHTYKTHMAAVRLPSSISTNEPQNPSPFHVSPLNSLFTSINVTLSTLSNSLIDSVHAFGALKSGLHSYVTACQISLKFGETTTGVFERARNAVDSFIRSACPKAAEQLLAIYDRLAEGKPEPLAQCLTSCRRILLTVADIVFPPREEDYSDKIGKKRKVGPEEYKNRLLAFLDQHLSSAGTYALVEGEIGHLAARLDAVYEKTSKGVHADVSAAEADLAVIHTYLFLAEVSRFWPITAPSLSEAQSAI